MRGVLMHRREDQPSAHEGAKVIRFAVFGGVSGVCLMLWMLAAPRVRRTGVV